MIKHPDRVDPLMRRLISEDGQEKAWSLLGDVETNDAAKAEEGVERGERDLPSLTRTASLSEDFLHRNWWSHRQRVLAAMAIAGEPESAIARVQDCGKFATVQRCTTTGEYRVRGSRCRHRFCRRCSMATSLNVADNLAGMINKAKLWCSHATLTLKHVPGPPGPIRQRLYECFKKLRNLPIWKRHVEGGAAFCQMHVSKKDGMWHIHFHIILEHHYIKQKLLSNLWWEVTGDSTNVWLERIRDTDSVVREATRYVASPIDKTTAKSTAHLAHAIAACHGARLCFTFGSWRGQELHAKRPEPDGVEWVDEMYLGDLLHKAWAGDEACKLILAQLLKSEISATGPPDLFH